MLMSNLKLHSSSLTTRPIVDILHLTRSLTVKRSGFGEKFSFSLPGDLPLCSEMGAGKGLNFTVFFFSFVDKNKADTHS